MSPPEGGWWDNESWNDSGGSGTVFELDPTKLDESGVYSDERWASAMCGVNLQRTVDNPDDKVRSVVNHTWSNTNIDVSFGISVGIPPTGGIEVGLNPETSVKSEGVGTRPDGSALAATDPA